MEINVMWKQLFKHGAASILRWRDVMPQFFTIGVLWSAYLMATLLIEGPVDPRLAAFVPMLFWPTVVGSGVSFVVASIKSALPAAIAWIAVVPLFLLDLGVAAKIALALANIGVVLHAIGFTFHGGRRAGAH
ncbi:MAG: hypothetical protein CVV05_01635 [Gammaproteobacteria bacterium HGW-Gammaproteobacteria-1]|jgi:hypothetical protein|nr:MAG: hypothetical protein CVV05_01635 [Gammaproteobacteria bacterium HGW-Gammaproteobacteria-1]